MVNTVTVCKKDGRLMKTTTARLVLPFLSKVFGKLILRTFHLYLKALLFGLKTFHSNQHALFRHLWKNETELYIYIYIYIYMSCFIETTLMAISKACDLFITLSLDCKIRGIFDFNKEALDLIIWKVRRSVSKLVLDIVSSRIL